MGTDEIRLYDFRKKKARQIRTIRYDMIVEEFYPLPKDQRIDIRF